ncbi:hypothetical protein D3C85_1585390 [compost metagenome]
MKISRKLMLRVTPVTRSSESYSPPCGVVVSARVRVLVSVACWMLETRPTFWNGTAVPARRAFRWPPMTTVSFLMVMAYFSSGLAT